MKLRSVGIVLIGVCGQMLQLINHKWRIVVSAIGFVLFGLGGVLFSLLVFPAIFICFRGRKSRRDATRRTMRVMFRLFLSILSGLKAFSVSYEGKEQISKLRGVVVIANHPTLIDVILILSVLPNAQCIVKRELWKNPFLAGVVEAAGFIPNDKNQEEVIADCVQSLRRGDNLVIFPEGTRSNPEGLHAFYRGFAHVALDAGVDVQCLNISCRPLILAKAMSWSDLGDSRSEFSLAVGRRISIAEYSKVSPRSLAARRMVRDVEGYYTGRTQNVLS